jgi:N-acetylneuraminic acid mutarotase
MSWRLPGPLAREAAVLLPDGRRVMVAGGLLPDDTSTGSTYTLDLRTGRTAAGAPLPVPVHDTAGALLGGRVLVLGGGGASEQPVVQARDAHGWQVLGRLPSARSDLTAVTAGGRAYVVGGYDGVSPALPEVLRSRDGRTWSVAGRLPVPVRYAATVVAGGAVWVFGGERSGAEVDAVQRVDLATGRARVVAHLPTPTGHEAAAVFGDRVLLAGGRLGSNTLTDRMWWFDLRSHEFRSAGRLPRPRADSAVVQPDPSTAYLVGGETPAFSDRVVRLRWQ